MRDQFFGERTLSQHGDDLMLLNIFYLIGIKEPSYLDIGAHHPIFISNTALLYERGSRGVNVEANPNLISEFYRMRAQDKNLNIGIASKAGKMPFYMIDSHSGRNTFSKKEAEKFCEENPQFKITEVKEIEVMTINDLIVQLGGEYPDLLSIDAEGLDREIIESANFMATKPKVICVETYGENAEAIKFYLKRFGYFPYCRMISNLIFVEEKYREKLY